MPRSAAASLQHNHRPVRLRPHSQISSSTGRPLPPARLPTSLRYNHRPARLRPRSVNNRRRGERPAPLGCGLAARLCPAPLGYGLRYATAGIGRSGSNPPSCVPHTALPLPPTPPKGDWRLLPRGRRAPLRMLTLLGLCLQSKRGTFRDRFSRLLAERPPRLASVGLLDPRHFSTHGVPAFLPPPPTPPKGDWRSLRWRLRRTRRREPTRRTRR